MNDILFPLYRPHSRRCLGRVVVALCLLAVPALQAQTNFNFNNSTDPGWEHWLPTDYSLLADFYLAGGSGVYTNDAMLGSITFTTNNSSAGNRAYYFKAGGTNLAVNLPQAGSFFTNGPALTNFTMTGEFFSWSNNQSQSFGIIGRVQTPLPVVALPGTETLERTLAPVGVMLEYVNRRSKLAFYNQPGGTDLLCLAIPTSIDLTPDKLKGGGGDFVGPGQSPVPGRSSSPNSTNGHYRLILTAHGINVTGQIVDLSTGLPMTFSGQTTVNTNILYASLTNRYVNEPGTNGGTYGFYATVGDSINQQPPWPINPHFDNFAIVPGVVMLESATAATGPYVVDTGAGLEVYPKRITVPASGSTQFYRIKWLDADHTPTITGITLVGSNVVLTYN